MFKKKKHKISDLIHPQCLDDNCCHFIGSDLIYYPCCFTRVAEGQKHFKELMGKDIKYLDIRKYNQSQIMKSKAWKKLLKSFESEPISTCLEMCPKKNKPKEDFDGRNGYTIFK